MTKLTYKMNLVNHSEPLQVTKLIDKPQLLAMSDNQDVFEEDDDCNIQPLYDVLIVHATNELTQYDDNELLHGSNSSGKYIKSHTIFR